MAKRKTSARRPGRRAQKTERVSRRAIAQEALGLGLVAIALISAISLLTYAPADPSFALEPVDNGAGAVGATLAAALIHAVGAGAAVLVAGILVAGLRLLLGGRIAFPGARFWVGAALLFLSVSTIPALLGEMAAGFGWATGGVLGEALAHTERLLLSGPGALVLNTLAFLVGALSVVGVPPGQGLAALLSGAVVSAAWVGQHVAWAGGWVRERAARMTGLASGWVASIGVRREQRARRARVAAARDDAPMVAPDAQAVGSPHAVPVAATATKRGAAAPDIVDHRSKPVEEPEQETFTFQDRPAAGPYKQPDLDIFQRAPDGGRTYDRDSLIMNSRILEKKLSDFGVSGRVVTVHPGPVITMYEFEPAPGVKVNKITNLSDDLALALRALSVRIVAPIPGKSVVGIEVPNPEREVVYIRDLLESKSFRSSESKLPLALGKDIFGNPVETDLAKAPHLLVAGATGTGKSVFLNSLLCSILVRATPDEVKLLLVDPKLLELSIYEGIPHLIADVVTNPKRAAAALQGIVQKMEERYQMMAALGVRNIAQFNDRVEEELEAGNRTFRLKKRPGEEEAREVEYQKIPYIVVVIDELADLMLVSARDVEEALQRLAQMARASGIHLVLATQRPSVDVLTGIIKANFPARISFQVSSRTDSRTILDQGGAEHLLGQGDMLFLPPGTAKLQRLHGSFVTEREVASLVEYLRTQGAPKFDDDLVRLKEESERQETRPEDTDEHYDAAVAIVAETRNASISYVQRRLKIGYNRAARIVEQMEAEGVVGPQVGTKPREVFVRPIGADVELEEL